MSHEIVSKPASLVRLPHRRHGRAADSDIPAMAHITQPDHRRDVGLMPWAMQLYAVSSEDPDRLVQTLTGAILGCGGWVLSRGASDSGAVNLLFEFERRICVDIYSVLIAAGLDLSQSGHVRFTELCQCTALNLKNSGREVASVDIEIQTLPPETAAEEHYEYA